jgi:oligoendopeptidase F
MSLRKGESRVLTNYIPSYDGVSTVAHELGHAYHNYNLIDRTSCNARRP